MFDATDEDPDGRFSRCDACLDGHPSGSDNCDPDIDGFYDDPACSCGAGGNDWRCHNPVVVDSCPGVPNPDAGGRWCVQCGRARRGLAAGSRAYVVGLFQVLMVDISDPADPVVLQQLGLLPERDGGLRVYAAGDCGRLDALLDRLCDATGACGAFGKAAAARE